MDTSLICVGRSWLCACRLFPTTSARVRSCLGLDDRQQPAARRSATHPRWAAAARWGRRNWQWEYRKNKATFHAVPPAAPAGTRAPPACPGTRLARAWPAAPHARGWPALVAAGRPFSTAGGVHPVAHALPPAVPPARWRGSGGTLAQPAPPDGGGPCGLGVGAGQPAPLKGGRRTNRGDVTQRLKNAGKKNMRKGA
jgi:hypothetical protein